MRTLLLHLIFFFFITEAFAQEVKYASTDSLLNDLHILTTTIRDNHPLMYRYTTKERFDNLVQRTELQIKNGVTPSLWYASVSKLVRSIGCGHTKALPTTNAEERMKWTNDLPFDIVIIDSAIYVSKAYTEKSKPYVGQRIIRINDAPVERFIGSAYNYISADGYNLTYKAYTLAHQFNFYLNMLIGNPDTLYFETPGGQFKIRYPTGYVREEPEDVATTFSELPDVPHTMLLTVPDFDDDKSKLKKCFQYISEHDIQHLIIDLRDNGGGNGNIGTDLVAYIIDSTLTYYIDKKTAPLQYKAYISDRQGILISNKYIQPDSLTRSYYFTIKPERKYHYEGEVYVLTNGGTFSTGAFVASALKHLAGATFIGEETGGCEYGIGGGVIGTLTLPYTGLRVQIPMYGWRFNTMATDTGRGVVPDVMARKEPDDFITGADPVLETAKEMISDR
ncbi:MAG: hypothetical protein IPL92_11210 [Saprospiraceae bacterium]|nr:hypothetical protein [Candidatus Opimibacter iunctus]